VRNIINLIVNQKCTRAESYNICTEDYMASWVLKIMRTEYKPQKACACIYMYVSQIKVILHAAICTYMYITFSVMYKKYKKSALEKQLKNWNDNCLSLFTRTNKHSLFRWEEKGKVGLMEFAYINVFNSSGIKKC